MANVTCIVSSGTRGLHQSVHLRRKQIMGSRDVTEILRITSVKIDFCAFFETLKIRVYFSTIYSRVKREANGVEK